jgi:type VI secretion system protein ImpA
MASRQVLDIPSLLGEIPNGDPAGSVLSYLRDQLEEARKEEEPNPDDPSLPNIPRKVDWARIIEQAQDALTNSSKDLRLACYLTEALVKLHGFAGLREGLQLVHDLVEQCWDRLLPKPEEEEGMEIRALPFHWLTDPERGALFANTLRGAALIQLKNQPGAYGLGDWQQSQRIGQPIARAQMSMAEPLSPEILDHVTESLELLNRLDELLNNQLGRINAPNWGDLLKVLQECQQLLHQVSSKPGGSSATNGGVAVVNPESNGQRRAASSRDEVYQQIAELAGVLAELEPHSPIPDLLRRAVELGRMPFRDLIQELIREPNTLAELRREFGLKELMSSEPSSE